MGRAPLAVTLGDPSGIGPDILLKSWAERDRQKLPGFFISGDVEFLSKRAEQLKLDISFSNYDGAINDKHLSVLPLGHEIAGKAGNPISADAHATISSIDTCVDLTLSGQASGVVTCPINKKVLYDAGFNHPGHTEYLAELGARHTNTPIKSVMMLAGPQLRTIPVTVHIPLKDVPNKLTTEMVVEASKIAAHDLATRFDIANPRLAISGLNPHAGENGSMGHEDTQIVLPAIQALQSLGIDARGPLPADTMFHANARETYDVAICMYHDQALIPAKTLGFDDAVNVTLGLPFIRTSPDHGTAYNIAGTGKANPSSFIAALNMAADMANRSSKE